MPRLLDERFITMPGAAELTLLLTMIPRDHPAGERTVAMIEAKVVWPLFRQRAEMPLAHQRRIVTHQLEAPASVTVSHRYARSFCGVATPKLVA